MFCFFFLSLVPSGRAVTAALHQSTDGLSTLGGGGLLVKNVTISLLRRRPSSCSNFFLFEQWVCVFFFLKLEGLVYICPKFPWAKPLWPITQSPTKPGLFESPFKKHSTRSCQMLFLVSFHVKKKKKENMLRERRRKRKKKQNAVMTSGCCCCVRSCQPSKRFIKTLFALVSALTWTKKKKNPSASVFPDFSFWLQLSCLKKSNLMFTKALHLKTLTSPFYEFW